MTTIINAGYPKDGTPESRAYWAGVRKTLPRFEYTPPDTVSIACPRIYADRVSAFLNKLIAEAA